MLKKSTLQYLLKLRKNNNREWFLKNKAAFDAAKADFENFVADLFQSLARSDPRFAQVEPSKCIFRIYRDVRFTTDKTPYKTHFSVALRPAGRKDAEAGMYLQIDPFDKEETFIAAGYWLPEAPLLKAIRQEIEYNADEFKSIISNKKFKSFYGDLAPYKLKNAPKGVDKDHPDIELLKYTSYLVIHDFPVEELTTATFKKNVLKSHELAKPFLEFLNHSRH